MLDLVEEALDEVSFAVESKVAQALDDPVGFGRDNHASSAGLDAGNNGVTVISLAAQHTTGLDAIQQRPGWRAAGDIAGCQNEPQRIASRIAQGMQFGGQTAG